MSIFNVCPIDTCPVATTDRAVYLERIQALLLKSDFNIHELDQLIDFVVVSRQQDTACASSVAPRMEYETTTRNRLCLLHHVRYDSMSISTRTWLTSLIEQVLQVKIDIRSDATGAYLEPSDIVVFTELQPDRKRKDLEEMPQWFNNFILTILIALACTSLILGAGFVCKLLVGSSAASRNPYAAFFMPAPRQSSLPVPEHAIH